MCYHRKSRVFKGKAAPTSPERQQANTNTKAAELNLAPENYVDAEGHRSGKTEEHRPEWLKARGRLADPNVGALIVDTWDRPVRNVKLLLDLVDECERHGVRFIACSDSIDTRTAAGRFQLTIIASVGEFESNVASERQASAADWLRRERGRHVGWAPFGTMRVKTESDYTLLPSTRQQPNGSDFDALKAVYEMRLEGRWSIYSIAVRLNAAGWRFRGRNGELKFWDADRVRTVLRNHWLYAGFVVVGRAYRGDAEIIPGSHKPILPKTLTEPVATTFAGFAHGQKRTHESMTYALTGTLFCMCGERLAGAPRPDGRRYYFHRIRCQGGLPASYPAEQLEGLVREHVAAIQLPAAITATSEAIVSRAIASAQGGQKAVDKDHIDQALVRLRELYVEGDLSREDYDRRKARYELDLVSAGQPAELGPGNLAAINVAQVVQSATPQAFRDMVKALYIRIILNKDLSLTFEPRPWCADWA